MKPDDTITIVNILDELEDGGHLQGLSQVSAAELVTLADGLLERTVPLAAVRDTLLLASIGRNSRGNYPVAAIREALGDSGRLREVAHRAEARKARDANGTSSEV